MKRFVPGMWGATKAITMALLIMAVAWTLRGDAQTVDANHTKIVLSRSSTSPDELNSLLFARNGTPVDLYVWAVNVHNSSGASAFDVRFNFEPALGHITFLEWYDTWIQMYGRTASCLGGIGPNAVLGLAAGQAYTSCNTFLPPPPYGANGTGKIAHIQFTPGSAITTGAMDMQLSFLVDTPVNPADEQQIQASSPFVYVTITKCPDFDLNGEIDLFNDIFGVAFHFGLSSGDPGWDAVYDLDDNGNIDLFTDIFNTAFQFGGSC